jgi:hypothetical protein
MTFKEAGAEGIKIKRLKQNGYWQVSGTVGWFGFGMGYPMEYILNGERISMVRLSAEDIEANDWEVIE